MKSRVINLCIMFFMAQSMMAQLTLLGHVGESEEINRSSRLYAKDELLYAATAQGLYQCDLGDTISEWQKLPFMDGSVKDFIVRGDTLVAINNTNLCISIDGGVSARHISADSIVVESGSEGDVPSEKIQICSFAVSPYSIQRLYVVYRKYVSTETGEYSFLGLSYSENGGYSWSAVKTPVGFEGLYYNPLDENNLIAYTNEGLTANSIAKVYASTDGGASWVFTDGYIGNSITSFYDVVFHPTDKNRVMMYGAGIYATSENQGITWETIGGEPFNPIMGITPIEQFDGLVYDARKPDILYGSDQTAGFEAEKKVRILRSTDGGYSWEVFYTIENTHSVLSMCMNGNILAINTYAGGIYLLDVDAVDTAISPVVNGEDATPYYDLMGRKVAQPTRGIYIREGRKVVIE